MKKLFVFSLSIFLLLSCSKKQENSKPVQVYPPPHFIPNWHDNDTLANYYDDYATGFRLWDTMYTKTVGDTSEIIYNGQRYYVWKQPENVDDTFKDNQSIYKNCCINTIPFDTINAVAFGHWVSAYPTKYYDPIKKTWVHQFQEIGTDGSIHFKPVHLWVYFSATVY